MVPRQPDSSGSSARWVLESHRSDGRLSNPHSPRFRSQTRSRSRAIRFGGFLDGGSTIPGFILGIIVLDGGAQAAQVAIQARVLMVAAQRPEPREHDLHDFLLHRRVIRVSCPARWPGAWRFERHLSGGNRIRYSRLSCAVFSRSASRQGKLKQILSPVPLTIPQPSRTGFWLSVREAIQGTHQDFTQGSISRAVLLLATPMVLEMCMESLFAIVDIFWVTRLGSNAVATVGLTESMLTLVFSVALGVSMSTTAMVARRVGEHDHEGASTAASQSILLGLGIAFAMGLPGFFFARHLLALMGAPADLIATGHHYTSIAFGGTISVVLLFINNAVFRGAGDAAVAMRVLWFSNLINLVLDPLFIFGIGPFPRLGVTGAAVSTLIGRSCGVLYQLAILAGGRSRITVRLSTIRLNPRVIGTLIRVSSTGVLQFAIAHTSWIALVRMVSSFGSFAVAGYAIGIRVFMFVLLPSWGLSGAAATMVGQNLGAHKPERAVRAVYVTSVYNMIFLGAIAVILVMAPEAIVHVFTRDPQIVPFAVDCLTVIAWGNLFYAFGMVMVQAFNGAGDTVTPTIINVFGFWLCEIPLAFVLAFRAHLQVRGVFMAIPISEVFISTAGLVLFLRGSWKRKTI